MDHFCYVCLAFFMLFIAAFWLPVGKGLTSWSLFVMFNCVFVTFPCGILGQMRYMIVSIRDLCRLLNRVLVFPFQLQMVGSKCFFLRSNVLFSW